MSRAARRQQEEGTSMRPLAALVVLGLLAACEGAPNQAPAVDSTALMESRSTTTQGLSAEDISALDAAIVAAAKTVDPHASYRPLSQSLDGSKVYVTPAFPGAASTPWVVIDLNYNPTNTCGIAAEAVYTTDGWKTQGTASGAAQAVGKRQLVTIPLPAQPEGTQVELAALIRTCYGGQWHDSFWVNNAGANYRYRVFPSRALSFVGNRAAWADGIAVDTVGGISYAGHDVTVTVQTYPATAGAKLSLHYSLDGAAAATVPMAFDFDGAGELGNDVQWQAKVPAAALAKGAGVEFWLSATDVVGNTHWDSRGGQNFHLTIGDAAVVSWAGAGAFTFTKWAADCETRLNPGTTYNWCYRPQLSEPFRADNGVYQAYASWPHLALEVFVPGVTDRAMNDGAAAAIGNHFFKAEVYSDLASAAPGGAWSGIPMKYVTRRGNNFVFAYLPICQGANPVACGVGPIPDGTYQYKLRVSADHGRTWRWVGTESGANRTLEWDFLAPYNR
jgi:hypothetical protein